MNSTEPPRATPVSTIRSGFVAQMISWVAIMSAGSCIDGDAHPAPEVGVVISVRGMQRVHRGLERSAVAAERQGLNTLLFFECCAIVGTGHTRNAFKSALIYAARSNTRSYLRLPPSRSNEGGACQAAAEC